MHGLGGDEETDGQVGEGGELQVGWVADDHGSCGDGDGGAAAEGEGIGGAEVDLAAGGSEGDVGGSDGEGFEAELVGEDDADCRSAERDVDDLAIGGVLCAVFSLRIGQGYGRGGPGADPVVGGCGYGGVGC